ncbi:MAG: hypothetical protein N3B21_05415 [Clostridia bacterium]|nr:hypothetical protein [Clostridia bacterium]
MSQHNKVMTLTNAADTVFFTAAPPEQGGLHPVNCQPYEFWINLFKEFDFEKDSLTETIRKEFAERNVVQWVTKNAMVFRK